MYVETLRIRFRFRNKRKVFKPLSLYPSYFSPIPRLSICLPALLVRSLTQLHLCTRVRFSNSSISVFTTHIYIYIPVSLGNSTAVFCYFFCFAYIKIIQTLQTKNICKFPNCCVDFFFQINTLCNLNEIYSAIDRLYGHGDRDNNTVINLIKCI